MAIHQSVLTSTQTFPPSSEVVTMWQTDGAAHKLKPRSFHKSTHLQVYSADFHPSVNHAWHNALTLRFFPFFVLTFAYMFNSFLVLLHQFEVIYFFWEFTEISHTVSTWDLHQNPSSGYFLYYFHCLILLEPFVSLLTVSLYSPLQCVLLCHIWNTFCVMISNP